jgi:acetylornithine deacetylase/succinyl-diaminopimelate desuccinylase-like protein
MRPPMISQETLIRTYEEKKEHFIARWREFLKIESISTIPEYQGACEQCAAWVGEELKKLGFLVTIVPTATKPIVLAERVGNTGAPTVLYYGHYDVQPVDPVDAWVTPPFEPTLRDGRMYARGAQDNKGQTSFFIAALETLISLNQLTATVKMIIEGEEECGSEAVYAQLGSITPALKADVVLVADSEMDRPGRPAVTMGFRGIAHINVIITGPSHDLHSGMHGGVAPNPAHAAARLVASLHDAEGRIAVAGVYDGVAEPDSRTLELLASRAFSEQEYKDEVGILPSGGEKAYPPLVREALRPTIEVNGIHSGYGGAGGKTIIPSRAEVKLSARMVHGQDPEFVLSQLRKHIIAHIPPEFKVTFEHDAVGGPALSMSSSSPYAALAQQVISEGFGVEPVYSWSGGSIPVLARIIAASGGEPLLVGFGLGQDRIHSPNESFSLQQFFEGYLFYGLLLSRL